MRSFAPYLVAGFVSLTLIGGATWFCSSVRSTVARILDEEDVSMAQRGDDSFGLEVSSELEWRIGVADFLANFWFVWIPLVLGFCFGTATLLKS